MTDENRKKYDTFLKKLKTQIVYFKNTFEGAVIKSIPGTGYYVKFAGKQPFKAGDDNAVVAEGILEYNEISKKTYDNF